MSKPEPPDAPSARPAATLILVRDRHGRAPELLMVERSAQMRFAGGAAVFPGGAVDPDDLAYAERLGEAGEHDLPVEDAAARLAAIRETLEETGLGYAMAGIASGAQIKEARTRLHEGVPMSLLCADYGWQPVLDALVPWSHWLPPAHIPTRYDTRFYLGNATRIAAAGRVDETENVGLFWDDAHTILQRAEAEQLSLVFPTRRNLERLAQHDSFAALHDHAGGFPPRVIVPYIEERADGSFLCIPEGLGYPVREESLSTVKRG